MAAALIICPVCGNEVEAGQSRCPFCEHSCARLESRSPVPFLHRTVNLEKGRPPVAVALERLSSELAIARGQSIRVLTLIHGYGSSGRGGSIREEVRRQLEYERSRGMIRDMVVGESLGGRSGPARQLRRRFPLLSRFVDLSRPNPGITLVVL